MRQFWASWCLGGLLQIVGGQDVFLASRQRQPQIESQPTSLGTALANALMSGHDGWVFSFSPADNPNLCWDLPASVKGTMLQVWECNGHEGQLFYFDAGTYNIKYAGDASMCLDAREQQEGEQLMLWDCNGQPQQEFGFQYDITHDWGQITLGKDVDSQLAVELSASAQGEQVQVAKRTTSPNFYVKSGITIRSGFDYQVCLDLAGGDAFNGAEVEIWGCNGLTNQQWIFSSGSNAIKWAGDESFCIDSGALEAGQYLFLWECNGLDQQQWSYSEVNGGTIFLKNSPADGNLCLDIPDGQFEPGTAAEIWGCNGCWNQGWSVVGPKSEALASMRPQHDVLWRGDDNECPDHPRGGSTTPLPAPDNVFMPDCSLAAPGWPTFKSAKELSADTEWSSYFTTVYGEIPQTGYPICVGAFTQMAVRGGLGSKSASQCHDSIANDGDLVDEHSACCDPGPNVAVYIYNSQNTAREVPANHWAEVSHVSFDQDKDAAWYYLMFGSAIWWNVGKTQVFKDHPDVTSGLLGAGSKCHDDAGHSTPPTECEQDFNQWFKAARQLGLDSIQVTHHYDCGCGEKGPSSWVHNRLCQTEIIDVNGHGNNHGGCASDVYRAGWGASKQCSCDSGLAYTNCNGFGIR